MKCLKSILFVLVIIFVSGCANYMLGANMYILYGGDYVERWYLNSEYDGSDIPVGTAFYGASAEKIKDKFIVKYYVDDGKRSDVEIPKSDMWVVNHNGKSRIEQDDDNFFKYKKNTAGLYEKYILRGVYQIVVENRLVAIRSCDEEGWCKVYPNYNHSSDDVYVRKMILKEPLERTKTASQDNNLDE